MPPYHSLTTGSKGRGRAPTTIGFIHPSIHSPHVHESMMVVGYAAAASVLNKISSHPIGVLSSEIKCSIILTSKDLVFSSVHGAELPFKCVTSEVLGTSAYVGKQSTTLREDTVHYVWWEVVKTKQSSPHSSNKTKQSALIKQVKNRRQFPASFLKIG